MLKNYLLSFLFLGSTAYSQYITEDKILNNKKSYQLSSCIDLKCLKRTEEKIQSYDYITTFVNKYYVTYLVNIDTKNETKIKKKLKKYFPDMILRKQLPSNKKNLSIQNNHSLFITKYKLALESFKKRDYEKSYTLLNKLFQEKPDNLDVNYYLGRSAYESKRYDEAVSAYERFLFEKPDNNRVKLEMARSFFMTKTYKESKKLLLEIKTYPKIPNTTLQIINYYLKLIDQKINKHFVNGVLMLGVTYDSNINSKSKHEIFNNVYFPSANIYLDLENGTEDADNWYNQEIALINYKYKLNENQNIKQDFMIFNKGSFDSAHDSTKVTLVSYSPALSVKYNNKLTIDYALYTDFLRYGGENKLKTFALIPKFNFIYNSNNKLNGYIKYQKKSDQQDHTQDSIYKEASIRLIHTYNKQISLTSNIIFSDEKAKDTDQTGIDYSTIKGALSLNFKYSPTLFFTPSLSYSSTQYDDIDSSYFVKVKNKQLKFALSTTYVYSPKWILQGSFDQTKQNSNIDPNEYDKYTFGLNLIRIF